MDRSPAPLVISSLARRAFHGSNVGLPPPQRQKVTRPDVTAGDNDDTFNGKYGSAPARWIVDTQGADLQPVSHKYHNGG